MAAQAVMPATEVAATGAAKGGKRPPQSWLLLQLSAPPAPPCSRAAPAVLLSASGWLSGLLHNILSHTVTTNTREAPYDSVHWHGRAESTSTHIMVSKVVRWPTKFVSGS